MVHQGTKQRKRRNMRHGVAAWTWVLLTAITVVALTVGACALWLPDRAPAALDAARTLTSAAASVQDYSGAQQVNVVPTISADKELLGNASGIVTENWTGDEIRSGTRVYQVNDRAVVALHTATPLYRDLRTGDKGEDVRSLNDELGRLGYDSVPGSNVFNWNTSNGWRQLMIDAGNAGVEELSLADTMWIPADVVDVRDWKAQQGATVSAATAIGTVPGALTKLTIRGGRPSDQERSITVCGVTSALPAGSVEITDAETLRQIAQTEAYASKTPEERAAGIDAQVTFANTIQVLRVPAAAVFDVDGTAACIAVRNSDDVSAMPVQIISSELGASLVQPVNGNVGQIKTVVIGPQLNTLHCE